MTSVLRTKASEFQITRFISPGAALISLLAFAKKKKMGNWVAVVLGRLFRGGRDNFALYWD